MPRLPFVLAMLLALVAPASAQEEAGIRLSFDPPEHRVAQGGSVLGSLTLHNAQNESAALRIEMKAPPGIDPTLGRERVPVAAGASERVMFKINATRDAPEGLQSVHVRVLDVGTRLLVAEGTLDLHVMRDGPLPAPMLILSVAPTSVSASPGESREVEVRVTNVRAAPGLATLEASPTDGVHVTLPHRVELKPRETRVLVATLTVDPNATLGARQIELVARDPLSSHARNDARASVAVDVVAPPAADAPLDAADVGLVAGGVALVGGSVGAAWWLHRRGWALPLLAPLYTRIARNRVLDQPTRERIAALVEAEPGITFSDLCRRLDVAAGQLTHHARMLEQSGVLFSTRDGQHRRFFHVGHGRVAAVLPLGERALVHLQERGPATLADLARELGVSRQALHYHVKRMQAEGRASVDAAGRIVPLVSMARE